MIDIIESISLVLIISVISVAFIWLINEKDKGKSKDKKDDNA